MDGNINEFMKAFHASEDCQRALRKQPNGYGAIGWNGILDCVSLVVTEYCDAQLKAYHRWMTNGELP